MTAGVVSGFRGISPGSMGLVLALHGALAWALLQSPSVDVPPAPPVLSVSLLPRLPEVVAPVEPVPVVVPKVPKKTVTPPKPAEPLPRPVTPPIQTAAALPSPVDTPSDQNTHAPTPPVAAVAPAVPAPTPVLPVVSPPRFDAAYLDNPRPVYPPLSRRMGEQGKVLLRVAVDAGGRPTDVRLHQGSGSPRLDAAAIDAVQHWRFTPARQGEQAVAASVIVPIVFSLKE